MLEPMKLPAENIACDMDVCVNCKNDRNSVSVSGIIYRGDADENVKVKKVNECLKMLCSQHELHFIDNSNIKPRLLADGLHLDNVGNDILFANFLRCLKY